MGLVFAFEKLCEPGKAAVPEELKGVHPLDDFEEWFRGDAVKTLATLLAFNDQFAFPKNAQVLTERRLAEARLGDKSRKGQFIDRGQRL